MPSREMLTLIISIASGKSLEYSQCPPEEAGDFSSLSVRFYLTKGYYWANIWDVSMDDYLVNHFLHDLVVKTDK
jgi:monomeric isocitrate dehydrogenase